MRTDRATARRELAKIRTTRIDARHERVGDVLSIHDRYVREESEEE